MEESTDGMVPNISDYNSQFQNVATQTDLTDHEAYLTEVIDNNNKRICKLEQEIEELKGQLQDTCRQNDTLNKRLFTVENLKSKDSNAAFYFDFKTWDALWLFMSILILGRGVRIFPTGGPLLTSPLIIVRIKQMKHLQKRGELDL